MARRNAPDDPGAPATRPALLPAGFVVAEPGGGLHRLVKTVELLGSEAVIDERCRKFEGARFVHDPSPWPAPPGRWVTDDDAGVDQDSGVGGNDLRRHTECSGRILLQTRMFSVVPDERHQEFRPVDADRDADRHGRRGVGADNKWHADIVPITSVDLASWT